MALKPETRDKLKGVSAPRPSPPRSSSAACAASSSRTCVPLGPLKESMVGEAFTLRYMPAREDLNKLEVFRDRAHPQRKAVEECPPGAVMVIDSRKDARAASAGGILVARLMARGVGRRRDRRRLPRLRRRSPRSASPPTTSAPPRRPT